MKYSARILKAVELLLPGNILADIGCDHGYMSILSIETGKASSCYACDVAEGPLAIADKNVRAAGFENRIRTFLSDGFKNIPEGFDRALICGMGGALIIRILEEGKPGTGGIGQMILGPHSEVPELRRFLKEKTGFGILSETVVLDGGKYYILMDVRPEKCILPSGWDTYGSEEFLEFGNPCNQTDLGMYLKFLRHEQLKLETALTKTGESTGIRAAEKSEEICNKLKYVGGIIRFAEMRMKPDETET